MIRRQVFHLSLRAKRRSDCMSNREFKPNRKSVDDFLSDSNEPLLKFVDKCCIDKDGEKSRGHFKRVRYVTFFLNLNFKILFLMIESPCE